MVTILYVRDDARDQPAEHQVAEARASGFVFDEVLVDEGVSSISSTMRNRPSGKQLIARLGHDDTLVVKWLDRLGRNYPDMTRTIQNFLDKGVTIRTVIGGITFHGSPQTSAQRETTDTLIAFLHAAADAQAELFEKASKIGLEKANGSKDVFLGRQPSYDRHTLEIVLDMLSNGAAISTVAETTGLSRYAVARIKRNPDSAKSALLRWEGVSRSDD